MRAKHIIGSTIKQGAVQDDGALASAAAPPTSIDLRLDLAGAIAELPEAYRVVLILRDIDELTAPEVAEHLELSVEAVKSRLQRARAMMRARLVATGYRDPGVDAKAV